jgi:hypothetical protein
MSHSATIDPQLGQKTRGLKSPTPGGLCEAAPGVLRWWKASSQENWPLQATQEIRSSSSGIPRLLSDSEAAYS